MIGAPLDNSNTPHRTNNGNAPIATTKVVSTDVPLKTPPPPPPPVIGKLLLKQYKFKWRKRFWHYFYL